MLRAAPKKEESLSAQVKRHSQAKPEKKATYDGDAETTISTGSTLLDLAISGGRIRGGGIPKGIMVEIFGPSGAGKTVILCEIAGGVQRQGGEIMFRDPEARLNKQFARLFDLNVDTIEYDTPDTVPQVFESVRKWKPKSKANIHGVFADSLAALSTEWEKEGKDQYGMRRAKEFSEQCRLTCRTLTEEGYLMVCSNQVRQNLDAGPYGQKYTSPGGEAIGFYSSLRLRCMSAQKIKKTKTIRGKEISRVIGVQTTVEVFKSSVWKPFRQAELFIIFDYGVDDIRANLHFLKQHGPKIKKDDGNLYAGYSLDERILGDSIDKAIASIEQEELEQDLKEAVMGVWEDLEQEFQIERTPKKR